MTAPDNHDRASYVGSLVNASLEPGGPHYVALSDLLTVVAGTAMRGIGMEPDADGNMPDGAELFADTERLEGQIIGEIVEHCFQAARQYLEREPVTA